MSRNWVQHSATPGSVRPVYGAQYPPLKQAPPIDICSSVESFRDDASSTTPKSPAPVSNFAKYDASVSDAWDVHDVQLDRRAASASAAQVLERHARHQQEMTDSLDVIMPHVNSMPSKNSRVQAMQRLATQREPIPGSAVSASTSQPIPIYPRLPAFKSSTMTNTSNRRSPSPSRSNNNAVADHVNAVGANRNMPAFGVTGSREKDLVRFERLRKMLLNDATDDIDMDQLRKDCWMGIPHKLRPQAWRLLSGYLPASIERRAATMTRKRNEYWHYVEQYFHTRHEDQHQDTFRQIHIDIPRMCPLIPLFQQKMAQEIFERILYIWAIRHPASGYVQGINDLVTPFFVVFLSEFIREDAEVGNFDISQLPREHIEIVEADSFWCVSALLDTIQDNYTFAQPGIQRKVQQLKHLMSRVDHQLHQHLVQNNVEYLQFAFRWMNNLLMREIPLRATIRLWDTYLSEKNGFSRFHDYVCAAFLRMWSKQAQHEKDFQTVMLLLQNLPTQNWNDQQICELTADAYSLMSVFEGAKNHLQSTSTVGATY